ncbi:MAG: FadR/GntR family transcriptional regulator [Sporolactobacillus sp.]
MNNLLYSQIISDIEKSINEGMLEPNEKLPSERELSQRYKVSRTVIREAFKVLSEKGLVEVKAGKGTYVTRPTNKNVTKALERVIHSNNISIDDIIEVREELELIIVKKAVLRATEDGIEELKTFCSTMDQQKMNVSKFVEQDSLFHLKLAKLSNNHLFYLLINTFFEITDRSIFDLTHMVPSDIEDAQLQHWKIIEVIENRDLESAETIVREHMDMIKADVNILRKRNIL